MKILIVDDDTVFHEVMIASLRSIGYQDVTVASSAAETLTIVQTHSVAFDCILLDIQMPDMDGIGLCYALRSLLAYRRVPIIMVTSQSAKHYIDDAFTAGATDYITKPLDRLELKARIGMVARLVEERHKVRLMERLSDRRSGTVLNDMEFDTAIMIPDFDRGIECMALENYLLTVGRKGTLSLSAFAFHIENAGVIFGRASRSSFVDMLGDVALVLSETLKSDDVLISYAGSGNFVGVTNRALSVTPDEMSTMIELGLVEFESFYSSERLPTPRVRSGPLVRSPLFSLGSPTRILERAIQLAQRQPEKRSKFAGSAA